MVSELKRCEEGLHSGSSHSEVSELKQGTEDMHIRGSPMQHGRATVSERGPDMEQSFSRTKRFSTKGQPSLGQQSPKRARSVYTEQKGVGT